MLKSFLTVLMVLLFSFTFAQRSGTASFYHDKYDGRVAKDGSIFRQRGMTAASNTHAMGTKLRVTNKESGKSVIVTVTDTGGFKLPRIVDLSKAAFSKIAPLSQGLVKVLVEVVN
jgi:rare lipoprotein A